MNNSIRRRFINDKDDLTFIFLTRGTGYKVTVFNNHQDIETTLDSISKEAEVYYIKQLQSMIIEKLKQSSQITA
ncbi:hypothetical protein BC351_00665 [Paenibacillus ferrarius]|uniref:Uncharacterized protein n=1 Tax=Paenibacillus ferrarius TaxID=1469647 RepID=A0A1V4HT91_9BACL|nr:hypothetical protein [Paenibacillus ferrarius]OPH61785.1 hypothetical protein BC351_00665 [Paenibacillus ferrarius]